MIDLSKINNFNFSNIFFNINYNSFFKGNIFIYNDLQDDDEEDHNDEEEGHNEVEEGHNEVEEGHNEVEEHNEVEDHVVVECDMHVYEHILGHYELLQ